MRPRRRVPSTRPGALRRPEPKRLVLHPRVPLLHDGEGNHLEAARAAALLPHKRVEEAERARVDRARDCAEGDGGDDGDAARATPSASDDSSEAALGFAQCWSSGAVCAAEREGNLPVNALASSVGAMSSRSTCAPCCARRSRSAFSLVSGTCARPQDALRFRTETTGNGACVRGSPRRAPARLELEAHRGAGDGELLAELRQQLERLLLRAALGVDVEVEGADGALEDACFLR